MNKDSIAYKTVLLGVLCAVCGLLLSVVNNMTAPVIAEQAVQAEKENLVKIYPDGDFTEVTDFDDPSGLIEKVFTTDGGTVYKIDAKGYNSSGFVFMIGFNDDGSCAGFTAVSQSESPGLGARYFEDDYISQIDSITVDDQSPMLTGATLTGTGIREGVQAAEDLWHSTH